MVAWSAVSADNTTIRFTSDVDYESDTVSYLGFIDLGFLAPN
jgi:hypothetical protein